MSSYIARMMSAGEEVRLITRQHWITIARSSAGYTALAVVCLYAAGRAAAATDASWGPPLAMAATLVALGAAAGVLITLLRWRYRQFVVTTRRVIQVSGVFNRLVSDTNLDKVNDVVLAQSFLGRLLGYGNVEIISGSDVGVDEFNRIRDPLGFKRVMLDNKEDFDTLIRAAREGAGDPSAVLAELAALKEQGVLSGEEFEKKKAELLSRL
jgi:uncharacterized membrane protein YdbT with pleckstrin-like domain